jgi:hypothetical protein
MTIPSEPVVPGQQSPSPLGPPAGYTPGPPVKPPNPKLVFWTSPAGIAIMLGAVAILFLVGALMTRSSGGEATKDLAATIVSCDFTGDTATVGFTVTNNGAATQNATVHIEYRDGSGNRIDTDTSIVRKIAPGDTARCQEQTLLDAPATSGTCQITGVS